MMKKTLFSLSSLFLPYFLSLSLLTSCSVSDVKVKPYKQDAILQKKEKINFGCDFYGTSPQDFFWDIEKGTNFSDSFISLKTSKIVNNTISVVFTLSDEVPEYDTFYFSFVGVFFNKNKTIVKKTEPIYCYRNLKSPDLFSNLSISLQQMPHLDTFSNLSNQTSLEALSFLDIKPKTDEKYDIADFKRIKEILEQDFISYIWMVLANVRIINVNGLFSLNVNFSSIAGNISYLYNIEMKTFEHLDIEIDFNGKVENVLNVSGNIKFSMNNYEIIGVFCEKDENYNTLLYDKKRHILGNFIQAVPVNSDSSFNTSAKINLVPPYSISFNNESWINNEHFIGMGDGYADGRNYGVHIPCYNLNGDTFFKQYISSYYENKNQAGEIYDTLITKNIQPIVLDDSLFQKVYIKPQNSSKAHNSYSFNSKEEKDEFISLFSNPLNQWKNISVEVKGETKTFPFYKYLKYLCFDNTDVNNPNVIIRLNRCFAKNPNGEEYDFNKDNIIFEN